MFLDMKTPKKPDLTDVQDVDGRDAGERVVGGRGAGGRGAEILQGMTFIFFFPKFFSDCNLFQYASHLASFATSS